MVNYSGYQTAGYGRRSGGTRPNAVCAVWSMHLPLPGWNKYSATCLGRNPH